jgi:hypothetical protein
VLEKVVAASRTRVAARQHRELQRRKTALESSALPAKLADCRSNDVDRSELFIVEGDSALGTAKLARSSEFQALLPIRGKILNVQKASVGDMLKNAECASIIQVVGAGSGRTFDLEQVRYGKIIFMADADSDGAHIRCLLATLFFRYMRPLVDAGRVYTAVPPLHRFELTNPKKGQEKYLYTYSDAEYQRKTAELMKKGVRWKEPPQRYKGLGEMDADQLAETTMDPRHRTLRRITVDDGESRPAVFDLLMGNDVAPRKEFIVQGAYELDEKPHRRMTGRVACFDLDNTLIDRDAAFLAWARWWADREASASGGLARCRGHERQRGPAVTEARAHGYRRSGRLLLHLAGGRRPQARPEHLRDRRGSHRRYSRSRLDGRRPPVVRHRRWDQRRAEHHSCRHHHTVDGPAAIITSTRC